MKKNDPNSQIKVILKNIWIVTQLGLTVIICILLFFFIFLYLERQLETGGILLVVGVALGILSGGLAAHRLLKRFYQDS
jgi:ABC-type cobalamin transport system permease subunit